MTHRVFKPVILFHDHSYSTDPLSGVTHRIHIPYGDPYYTPLIQQKKQKVGRMLQSNGKAWYDIIQNSRNHSSTTTTPNSPKPSSSCHTSPQTPPSLVKDSKRKAQIDRRRRTQLLLQHDGSNQYTTTKRSNYYLTTSKQVHSKEMDDEEDQDSDNNSSITTATTSDSSSCTSSIIATSPVPSSTMITRKRRGNLPKSVTAVLKQWLIDHCRNPYPTETEKTGLKDKTGLTLNQISNWFINARRRLLPQILDSMHPHHTEQQHILDDPIPANMNHNLKKRKRSRIFYEQDVDDMMSLEQTTPTTVIRRRRRYNKKPSTVTSLTATT
ncbi:unnamed protein product [Mucor hiemalis]